MSTPEVPRLTMNDGRTIPQIGFGVYKIPDDETTDAVLTALEAGYRHIDTASFYANERAVGEAIRRSGVPRDDVFVTTKVWKDDNGYDSTLRSFDESLDRLGLDEVDLFLIHWPAPATDRYVESWRALERLRDEGGARSIGVANFHIHHLERLAHETETVPVVNQVELHPWLPQDAVLSYDAGHGILTEAWSPLARGHVLDPARLGPVTALAAKHGRTPAQIILRWHLQRGVVLIPKSVTPARIRENLDILDFELDEADMAAIASMETGERTGKDPDDNN